MQSEPSSEFSDRFRVCVGKAGSLYALAKDCRSTIPTLKRYLNGSEPSLTMLRRISAAAGVSIEWLATGQGPLTKTQEDGRPAYVRTMFEKMRHYLSALSEEQRQSIAKDAAVDPQLISRALLGEDSLAPADLWRIMGAAHFSFRALATGEGLRIEVPSPRAALRLQEAESRRLTDMLDELLSVIPSTRVRVYSVTSSSLSPQVEPGDIAFIDENSSPTEGPGPFLVRDGEAEFLAKVALFGERYEVSFVDKTIAPYSRAPGRDSGFHVVGRVVSVLRLLRRG